MDRDYIETDSYGAWRVLGSQGSASTIGNPMVESPWVALCVEKISGALKSVPWRVYTGELDNPRPVTGGPFAALIDKPSTKIGTASFWERVVSWLLLNGEAFLIALDAEGNPITSATAWPKSFAIPAPSVMREVTEDGVVKHWEAFDSKGRTVRIPVEAVIHPRSWNPANEFRGRSRFDVARQAAETHADGRQYNRRVLQNNGDPSGILQVKGKLTPEQRTALRSSWDARHAGPSNARRLGILDGEATYTSLSGNSKDMEFGESMSSAITEILAIFGVPKSMVSITDNLNYATARDQARWFWRNTVIPLGALVCDEITLWASPRTGGREWVAVDTSRVEVLRKDVDSKVPLLSPLMAAGYTADEANEALGMGLPVDPRQRHRATALSANPAMVPFEAFVGEEEAAGPPPQDQAMNGAQIAALVDLAAKVVLGEIPADTAKAIAQIAFQDIDAAEADAIFGPAAAAADRPRTVADAGGQAADSGGQPADTSRTHSVIVRRSMDERRADLEEQIRTVVIPGETRMARVSLRVLKAQRADVMDLVRGSRALSPDVLEQIEKLRGRWDEQVQSAFDKPLWDVARATRKRVGKQVGSDLGLDASDPRWLEIHGERIASLVQTDETTIDKVRDVIAKSIAGGLSDQEIQHAMLDAGIFTPARALNIARTESAMMNGQVNYETLREFEIDEHVWVTAGDDAVRQAHQDVDGEVRKIGEDFVVGGVPMKHSGDPAGGPANVCACRCQTEAWQ